MREKIFMSNLYGKFVPAVPDSAYEANLLISDDMPTWMRGAAAQCILDGHFKLIPNRKKTGPYLLRCWLSTPKLSEEDGQKGWESGNSLLLHRFFAPDDDDALHDHPWDFRTRILAGGYVEFLPHSMWSASDGIGPGYGQRQASHLAGSVITHKATDLHAVGSLLSALGPTWTLVETGPRVRAWDFFPPGKPRVPARAFLGY